MGLGWLVKAYSSHSIYYMGGGEGLIAILITKSQRLAHKAQRGLVPMLQGDGFASKLGGIVKVAMWLCTPLLVGL